MLFIQARCRINNAYAITRFEFLIQSRGHNIYDL